MQCHLANGGSHPESAAIAGLSVNYIIEQVHAFATGSGRMCARATWSGRD
jgi:cytochrome c553